MRQEDCNPEFTISLIQRNCLYQKIGKLSIGLDHIRSPAKSHKLLATISTQSQSSRSNASRTTIRSQCVAQSEFWRGDRNQYIACDSFPPSQAESIPILRGPGGLLVSGNITTTHSTHTALHTAHTLHYTAIATIPLIHHSLHSLQPTPVTAANTRHYREILQDFKPYPGTGDRLPLGTMGKEEEEEEQ